MLSHTTHDRLLALGLTDIAKALEEQRRSTAFAFDNLSFEECSVCWSTARLLNVTARNWPRGSSSLPCVRMPASKIWTCARRAAVTAV